MNNSQNMVKSSMSVWQFTLLISVTYAFGLVVSHLATVTETIYWSGYKLEKKNATGEWVESNRLRIGMEDGIQHVRFKLTIDDSEKWQRPIGLMLGGPFSAEVFWDERKISYKGKVGASKADEEPGSIDMIAFIPPALLKPGEHQIRMRISTQHLRVNDESVFHHIWLTPYRESGRRDIRYYAAPLIVLSALIVLSLQSFRIGRNAANPLHIGIGLYGFSIVVLLLSEISRALINYPYPYHELRGIIAWISNSVAGLALIYTCYRLTHSRLSKSILVTGIAISIVSSFVPMNSGDASLALDFMLLVAAPAAVFIMLLFKRQVNYLSTLPIFWIACLISNTLSIGLFLDSFQFVASLILIAGAWLWVYVDLSPDVKQAPKFEENTQFKVATPNGIKVILVEDCYALKGEGNYTNLMLAGGMTVLYQEGIGAIMNTAPLNFVRVHKSYAINIKAVKRLKSATGSKYWVEMTNGEKIPVSRYRVAELRSTLDQNT